MITNSLYEHYQKDVIPQLKEKRGYTNPMQIPKLVKVVLNTGVGSDKDRENLTAAADTLGQITGQDVTEEVIDSIFSNFCVGK